LATEEKLDRIIASLNEVDLKMRLGKLDSLFLLIPTLTGITFSIVQYSLRGMADVDLIIDLIPILILNVSIPLYIGYYRGGIKLNGHIALLERARGWVYLTASTFTFVFILACGRELYPELDRLVAHLEPSLRDPTGGLLKGSLWVIFIFAIWAASSQVGIRFLGLFEAKASDEHRQVLGRTARAGSAFAVVALSAKLLGTLPVIAVAAIVFCVYGGIHFERRARRLMSAL